MTGPLPLPPLPEDIRAILPESVVYDGITILVDHCRWSRGAIGAVLSRTYEHDERKLVRELLQNGDRVIEMGTGLGLVAMLAQRQCGPGRVIGFEANPEMIETARHNVQRNGMQIDLNNNILVNNAARPNTPGVIRFKIGENFLTSAISPVYPVKAEIDVPVAVLEDEIGRHEATVLILDIEGDERNLLGCAELAPIKLIVSEIHFDTIGIEGFRGLVEELASKGLEIDWRHVRGSTFTFRREKMPTAAVSLAEYVEARLAESGGDMASAAAKYRRLAELVPGSLHVSLAIARCQLAAKEDAEAVHTLDALDAEDARDPDAVLMLGVALWRLKNLETMETILRRGIARGLKTPALWALLGRAMLAQNKLHGSLKCFAKSTALDPTNAQVRAATARCLSALGRAEESADQFRMAGLLGLETSDVAGASPEEGKG